MFPICDTNVICQRPCRASWPGPVHSDPREVHSMSPTGKMYDNRFCSVVVIKSRKIIHWRDDMDSLAAMFAPWNTWATRNLSAYSCGLIPAGAYADRPLNLWMVWVIRWFSREGRLNCISPLHTGCGFCSQIGLIKAKAHNAKPLCLQAKAMRVKHSQSPV